MDAKKYNNIKLGFGIGKTVVSFLLILLFVLLEYSTYLENFVSGLVENNYLQFLVFTGIVGIASSIIFFPVNYYTDFYLEHKNNLSNQTFLSWIWENLKESLVGLVIGLPILFFFYFTIIQFQSMWWLPFAILLFVFSVLLAQILPIVILPLFYKVSPYEDEEMKDKIVKLAKNAGMKLQNVYTFNMSKNTKKANAAFTGLGKTKRIILGDTLVENYSNEEIETVLAHEFGHYKHKHIVKNIFIGTIFSFATLYLIALFYDLSLTWFGFERLERIAALPILALWGMVIGLITTPLSNIISRKYEYEADSYAINETKNKEGFINALEKLNEQNKGDEDPHPLVEWFFYSHPSIKNRKAAIESLEL